jgi:hypothetical protein
MVRSLMPYLIAVIILVFLAGAVDATVKALAIRAVSQNSKK